MYERGSTDDVERLQRAIAATSLTEAQCPACWQAGAGRICDEHRRIGRRNIAELRRRYRWLNDREPDLAHPH